MSFAAKRSVYSDIPSSSSQSAICGSRPLANLSLLTELF